MPFRSNIRPGLVLMLLGLTGCAAPIKALMGEPVPVVDQATLTAADAQDEALRLALMEKGKALLRARGQHPEDAPSVARITPVPKAPGAPAAQGANVAPGNTPAPRGATPAVSAMLARARIAEAPRPAPSPAAASQPDLVRSIRVKDETRFQSSPTGSAERKPDQVVIRFAPGVTGLDAEGNRALADLARRSELAASATIVLVAGLAGRGTPWERMQAASERLEIIARHVPPPLQVERRFELELENQSVRLELHREAR